MPINPNIPLQANTVYDPSQGIARLASAIRQGRQNKRQEELDAQNKNAQDIQNKANQYQIDLANKKIEELGYKDKLKKWGADLVRVKSLIDSGNLTQARHELIQRKANLVEQQINDPRVNTTDTDELISYIDNGDLNGFNSVVDSELKGLQTLGLIDVSGGSKGGGIGTYNPRDYTTESWAKFVKTLDAGDLQRYEANKSLKIGGEVYDYNPATSTYDLRFSADKVGETTAVVEGAKEGAKLSAQLKLKPEVETAVKLAIGSANAVVEKNKQERSNAKAQNVYDTAMTGLISALDNTVTGPFAGWSPALTSNQQIADGAVAAMAPVLKQIFRSAGEGVFTDKDQELLIKMVPTRKDRPEARATKLQNIDAIVRAKLSQPEANRISKEQKASKQDDRGDLTEQEYQELLQLRAKHLK